MKTVNTFITLLFVVFAHAENKIAAQLISQGKYQEAIVALTTALKANSKDAVDWFNLGVANYKIKNYQVAAKALQKVVDLKSDLTNAALYYKGLSEFNLQQNGAALSTISQISEKSPFYQNANDLKSAIEKQSDEFYQEALLAYEEGDSAVCEESLQDSLLADHPLGVTLLEKCKIKIKDSPTAEETIKSETSKLYLNAQISGGYTNNAYLTTTATTGRLSAEAALGGEYLISADTSDFGVGAQYSSSAFASGNTGATKTIGGQESLLMVYVPYTKYISNQELSIEAHYSSTTVDAVSAYYEQGLLLGYRYNLADYSFSLFPELIKKTARNTSYSYMEGTYSAVRFSASYETDKTKLTAYVSPSQAATGDEAVTGGTIPYANRGLEIGALLSRWLGEKFKATLILSNNKKNYTNKYSNIYREDETRFLKAQVLYKASANTKVYMESLNTTNQSNYDNTQLTNKNYRENAINLGIIFNN